MFQRRIRTPPLGELVEAQALTVNGPSGAVLDLFAELGGSHGRRRRRWEPSEQLVSQLARLSVASMNALDAEVRARHDSQRAGLEAERRGIESHLGHASSPTDPSVGTLDELHRRRTAGDDARRRQRLAIIEAALGELQAGDAAIAESATARRQALIDAAAMLWSAYRVAYVDSFPGPTYGQSYGPRIPNLPTIISDGFSSDLEAGAPRPCMSDPDERLASEKPLKETSRT